MAESTALDWFARTVPLLVAAALAAFPGCTTSAPVTISDEMVERIMSRSPVEYRATPTDDGGFIIRKR